MKFGKKEEEEMEGTGIIQKTTHQKATHNPDIVLDTVPFLA